MGVPIIRTIIFWGLYWGTPILGNYQMTAIFFGVSYDDCNYAGYKGIMLVIIQGL